MCLSRGASSHASSQRQQADVARSDRSCGLHNSRPNPSAPVRERGLCGRARRRADCVRRCRAPAGTGRPCSRSSTARGRGRRRRARRCRRSGSRPGRARPSPRSRRALSASSRAARWTRVAGIRSGSWQGGGLTNRRRRATVPNAVWNHIRTWRERWPTDVATQQVTPRTGALCCSRRAPVRTGPRWCPGRLAVTSGAPIARARLPQNAVLIEATPASSRLSVVADPAQAAEARKHPYSAGRRGPRAPDRRRLGSARTV